MLFVVTKHIKYGSVRDTGKVNFQSNEQMNAHKIKLSKWIKESKNAEDKHEIEAVYSDGTIIYGKVIA